MADSGLTLESKKIFFFNSEHLSWPYLTLLLGNDLQQKLGWGEGLLSVQYKAP